MNEKLQSSEGEGCGSVDNGSSRVVPTSAVQASAFTVEPLVSFCAKGKTLVVAADGEKLGLRFKQLVDSRRRRLTLVELQ